MQLPSFEHEQSYWQQGISLVAGVDEAGMGALAGPVVAAAVIFTPDNLGILDIEPGKKRGLRIRDSKLLSAKQREALVPHITALSAAWGIGEASVEEITALNIRRASHLAMQRAIAQLSVVPELLLIDGNPAQIHDVIPAVNIIDGDALSVSIAAASILAKTHRDQLMCSLDVNFPQYGFALHKGYGSQHHLQMLSTHGATPHHRTTYAPVAQLLQKTSA